jgi:predicted phosphoadenosine phosphosulfate sulfurtransferase
MEKNKIVKGKIMGRKKNAGKSCLELARERLEIAFDKLDTLIVMFSGGKDSTACLNLMLELYEKKGIEKKLEVHHFDEEAIPFETEHYVRRVAQLKNVELKWWCIPVKHRNGCSKTSPFWYPWAPEEKEKWVRPLPPEAITELQGFPEKVEDRLAIPDLNGLLFNPKKYGNVGLVMGIRADESITRLRAVLSGRNREDAFIIPFNEGTAQKNVYKVYPIYDWVTADVWTAPKKLGWDYNTTYDIYDKIGLAPKDQRVAPPYGEEPMRGLYQYRECFPDIWEKMQTRVPGASTAARYSHTYVYAYGKLPPKPSDMEWIEFLKFWVGRHKKEYRNQIYEQIKTFINSHYTKTKEPILQKNIHPLTGISWEFLLRIAIRGDFKGRKLPRFALDDKEYITLRRKYNEARYSKSTN